MKNGKLYYLEGLRGIASIIVFLAQVKIIFPMSFSDDLLIGLQILIGSNTPSYSIHPSINTFFDGVLTISGQYLSHNWV